jgi:Sugar (and other) transporter
MPFPFSPRWLASKDRFDEALGVLADIHAAGDKNHPIVRAEYKDVCQAAEEAKSVRWHMLFGRKMWRRTLIGCFTQIWQQLTGANVQMYYIVYVFYMAGLTGNANLVSSSIQYVIFVAMNVPAMIFIDSWGRRNMLLWGSAGMGAFNFIVGVHLISRLSDFRLCWPHMDILSIL